MSWSSQDSILILLVAEELKASMIQTRQLSGRACRRGGCIQFCDSVKVFIMTGRRDGVINKQPLQRFRSWQLFNLQCKITYTKHFEDLRETDVLGLSIADLILFIFLLVRLLELVERSRDVRSLNHVHPEPVPIRCLDPIVHLKQVITIAIVDKLVSYI